MPQTGKELARRWFEEVWNKKRREAIGEMLLPDSLIHEGNDTTQGPDGFYPFFDRIQASFSDLLLTIDDVFEEGDRVCVRWSCTMRHTGAGLGIAPSDKQVHTTGVSILRTANGKMLEGWQNWDMLGLLQQINGLPMASTYIAAAAG
jgi:predicted ester cyclase